MSTHWAHRANELSASSIAAGDPDGWFDRLYAESAAGEVSAPWARDEAHPVLGAWLDDGPGADVAPPARAVVVGCGLGTDAEHLAARGFATTGFDLSEHAIDLARERHPGSPVDYRVADLRALPADLVGAFDLVVEIWTLQAVPDPPRAELAAGIASLLAPGGTLLVVDLCAPEDGADGGDPDDGPPFQLTEADLARLEVDGVRRVDLTADGQTWVGTFRRDPAR